MINPLIPLIALPIACCFFLTITAAAQTSATIDSTDFYYKALVRNTHELDSLIKITPKEYQKVQDLNYKIKTAQAGAKSSGQDTVLLKKTLHREEERFDALLVRMDSLTGVVNYQRGWLENRSKKPKSSTQ